MVTAAVLEAVDTQPIGTFPDSHCLIDAESSLGLLGTPWAFAAASEMTVAIATALLEKIRLSSATVKHRGASFVRLMSKTHTYMSLPRVCE
jgi:hypothetical protein